MSVKDRKFKNIFVFQRFHRKIIAFIILANLTISTSLYFFARHFMNNIVFKSIEFGIPKHHNIYKLINAINEQMLITLILCIVCSSIILTIGTYIITHRVSGPLYRLSQHLDLLINNDQLEEVNFRQNDYILDVEQKFNHFIRNTRKKIKSTNKSQF